MYINPDDRNKSSWGTLQPNNLKKKNTICKAAKKNTAVQIMQQKQFIKNQELSLRLVKDKQLANLEKRKKEIIDNIKDVCERNKPILSRFMGISSDIDNILTGNAEYVLDNMDALSVGQTISGLQMSVIMGNTDLLREYYNSGQSVSFQQFIQEHATDDELAQLEAIMDASGNLNFKEIRDQDIKGVTELLELIKKEYEQLFNINDKIKQCKKDADEQIKQLNNSLTDINKNMSESFEKNKVLDKPKNKKKKINEIV